ncbi:MAG: hypothetical protein RBU30_22200 [Polyangia bacterium]|nr:hypothetical protein [Polyangia bacterium]
MTSCKLAAAPALRAASRTPAAGVGAIGAGVVLAGAGRDAEPAPDTATWGIGWLGVGLVAGAAGAPGISRGRALGAGACAPDTGALAAQGATGRTGVP